ncbi:MAG: hypothetical protein A3K10_11730 [Bacteroidetes bacterium RIFCSPLOWO2_12_FULL_31_6]|nr:MAG: hypothetical protein A3K10_11730 [Bacteroidetes bacterium RIFCSPLOWO2_12_FULL_31_6]
MSAQTDSICTDFETSAFFIKNLSNSWQIGSPNKVVFNNSYSPVSSIVTDTVNTYPSNDTSIFYAVYAPTWFANYLSTYAPFRIEFYHRFHTDTLTDFGTIELSKDGGNTWINGLDGFYSYNYTPMDNSHIFLGTNDTIYSLVVTGNSNGWVHSTITIDLDWWNISGIPLDSIIVKFTFKSDSVNNFKDGWQIDNLCIKYLIPLGIEEIESKNNLNVYPNPTQDYFIVNYNLQDNSKAVFRLYDVMGKEVIIQPITDMVGELKISSSTLKQGIYFYQVIGEKENFFGKLIIQ